MTYYALRLRGILRGVGRQTEEHIPIGWPVSPGHAMAREILISERLRAVILAGVIAVGLTLFLFYALIPGIGGAETKRMFRELAPIMPGLFLFSVAYELGVAGLISHWLRAQREPHRAWAYVGAAVEVSLPTLAIILWAQVFEPISALGSVTSVFYLLFILLALLRLDFWLCAYTGVLAAVQYIAVVLILFRHDVRLPAPAHTPTFLADRTHYVIMGCLYALLGVIAGLVALRIKRQFELSVRDMEERSRVVSMFGQYVSPAVVDKLLHQQVELGGEMRRVCVMFLDIRNFSVYAHAHSPNEVVAYLNTLFSSMIDTVNRFGGIVNKFLGDGFMAIFGAPVDSGDNCQNAAAAAIAIVRELGALNDAGSIAPTRIGIGLHVGEVVTGNVGSNARKEYTIIGSAVNLAHQIEQLNKQFGTCVLVSEAVRASCQGFEASEIGFAHVKGQPEPVRVFRLA